MRDNLGTISGSSANRLPNKTKVQFDQEIVELAQLFYLGKIIRIDLYAEGFGDSL
jgi:hypothetical protein